jgi:hypothetical protein
MPQLTALPEIIGLPPSTPETDVIIKSTFPVMEIIPCIPAGLSQNLFTLGTDIGRYKKILNNHGYSIAGNSVKVAFLSDNFPTDTFSNFYAESFLGSGLQIVSEEASQFGQMLGARTWTQAGQRVLGAVAGLGKSTGIETLGTVAKGIGNMATTVAKGFNDAASKMGPIGSYIQKAASLANQTLGGRIDLPQIWKNSGFTPSYTITIRLFNPNPGNSEVTKKYITGPLCALLLLALPTSSDGLFYSWPFFHQIRVPGLLNLPESYIGNITVVKGGDQQVISYKQNMGMCDVRIEFGCLFDTLVADEGGNEISGRPSLKEYIKELETGREPPVPINTLGTYAEPELIRLRRVTANSVRRTQEVGNVSGEPDARVSQQDVRDYYQLVAENPAF